MLTLTADQIRLLLTLTEEEWTRVDGDKGFGDIRITDRQIQIEDIQERLREALEVEV